jgi:16S rRNA (adenine1518-N6/adenine1519-N6)-dimethyltransferase
MLAQSGLHPKKRFGQNFLTNTGAATRIAQLALADASTPRVLEIGAGTGVLTHALLDAGGDVTALEIDRDLIALLRERDDLRNANIVEADALTFDYADWAGTQPWRIAGNLPYNIATPLIMRLIEMESGPQALTVMIQKDVADRLVAQPGTASYGSLSVAVRYAMDIERAFNLGANSFYPAPKVQSSVVQLVRRAEPAVRPRDSDLFRKVVRAAFAYRRKTLANSLVLALHLDRATVARALAQSNLAPEERGERLALDDFARLADALAEQ